MHATGAGAAYLSAGSAVSTTGGTVFRLACTLALTRSPERARSAGELVLCPAEALFPSRLEGPWSCGRWWNYLRRQLYVLDTYMFPHNRRVPVSASEVWRWGRRCADLRLTCRPAGGGARRRVNHGLLFAQTYASLAFALPVVPAAVRPATDRPLPLLQPLLVCMI